MGSWLSHWRNKKERIQIIGNLKFTREISTLHHGRPLSVHKRIFSFLCSPQYYFWVFLGACLIQNSTHSLLFSVQISHSRVTFRASICLAQRPCHDFDEIYFFLGFQYFWVGSVVSMLPRRHKLYRNASRSSTVLQMDTKSIYRLNWGNSENWASPFNQAGNPLLQLEISRNWDRFVEICTESLWKTTSGPSVPNMKQFGPVVLVLEFGLAR